MQLEGKRVLVTGGAGFIGSHLVDRLLSDGKVGRLSVLDNLSNGRPENLADLGRDPRLTLIQGDVLDFGDVERALESAEIVFHLACLGVRHSLREPVVNHRVNAEGTLHMLEAARRRGVERFVYFSTSETYGTAQAPAIDERHPTWPETIYGASKLAGEAYARAYHRTWQVRTIIVRPFNVYGPRSHYEGDSGEVIPRTIVRVLNGLAPIVFGDGEQTRDFLHVRDNARALVAIARCDEAVGQTINLGSGTEISVNRLCRTIAEAAGRPDLLPQHQPARPGDVRRLRVDNGVVGRLIGFRPEIPFAEGIAELVEWFRTRPLAPREMLGRMTERNW